MRRIAVAATLALSFALAGCGDGFDERLPSIGVLPNDPAGMAARPSFSRAMGETNISYGDVTMEGICTGVIGVKNSLTVPAGVEAEVEFYRDDRVIAVRRYAWWPAEPAKGAQLPSETVIPPGQSRLMELTNDGVEGYSGPIDPAPTGCRVVAAHVEANPKSRPCEEKHGPGCPAVARAWVRGNDGRPARTTAPSSAPAAGSAEFEGAGAATAPVTGTASRP